jgi:LytS/YehU family sensor histidine kinase
MQGRVNPQFLFDSLAQVERLCDPEPGRADRLLERLIAYLRTATPLVDESSPALATEIALAESFLELVRIRDERFAYDIQVSDTAKGARLPPMLLLPLIEPASLFSERSPESESISLSCNVDEARQRLVVRVRFAATNPGVYRDEMLLPVRERLAQLYGEAASLVVARAEPGTTQLIMEIPHELAERSDR